MEHGVRLKPEILGRNHLISQAGTRGSTSTAFLVYLQDYQALTMTPNELGPGEHWLTFPENVLVGDDSFTDRSGVHEQSGTALRVKSAFALSCRYPGQSLARVFERHAIRPGCCGFACLHRRLSILPCIAVRANQHGGLKRSLPQVGRFFGTSFAPGLPYEPCQPPLWCPFTVASFAPRVYIPSRYP
ncbi:hypothetical protein KCU81_g866, partial [Aureobasidium melanogenum]